MALAYEVESLDDVPEPLRDQYSEKDGRFVLEVQGAVPKAKLDEFRDNNIALMEQVKRYEGIDPDRVAELERDQKDRERRKAEERGEYERLLGETKEQYEARIAKKDEELSATRNQLKELVRDQRLKAELLDAGLRQGTLDVATAYAAKYVQTDTDQDGKLQTVVVDDDGKPRLNDAGDPMSLGEFVGWFSETDAGLALFESGLRKGSGAAGNNAGGGATSKKKRSEMTPAEKSAWIAAARENGDPDPVRSYMKLPE